MSLWCLTSSFGSIRLTVWEDISFEEFQDGRHLGYQNGTILAILNLYVARMPPIKFRLSVWEEMPFGEFQDSRLAAILDVGMERFLQFWISMPLWFLPLSFGSILLTVWEVVWRISRRPSQIWEWNYFSNSESLCHCDASHRVSAQSDLRFGRRCRFKNFKMAGGHLGYQNGTILAILNHHVATMPPTKFQLNPTYGSGGDVENVKS